MLFNSYTFIFAFLPLALLGFFACARLGPGIAAAWLALASLLFYAAWNWRFCGLLLVSIAVNFAGGRLLSRSAGKSRALLPALVALNLLTLGLFKYLGFLAATATTLLHTPIDIPAIVLPIGISFYTFTQIAFLVDTARGQARKPNFIHYLLFVTYFPHLVAGPILHHAEMMPQFRNAGTYAPRIDAIAVGLTVFMIGLFKKVVLADQVAVYADAAFAPAQAAGLSFSAAWGGALAYTLQIYFDFSGYSDMAIGLSKLFNIRLPINFASPYQATSIIDFWRRWHMTLSRFLRDYLYIPLGGNRHGPAWRMVNLMATMTLGGLWHGAGWTFVIWGALHGFYLVANHFWRGARIAANWPRPLAAFTGWAATFLAVVVAWVFFRAPDLRTALSVLAGMSGRHGRLLPVEFDSLEVALIAGLMGVALLCPNLARIMARDDLALSASAVLPSRWLRWRPTPAWATLCAAMFILSLLQMTHVSPFLYFQF